MTTPAEDAAEIKRLSQLVWQSHAGSRGGNLDTLIEAIDRLAARAAADAQAAGEVVVTKNSRGVIVAVTRQDEDGKILSTLAESDAQAAWAGPIDPIGAGMKWARLRAAATLDLPWMDSDVQDAFAAGATWAARAEARGSALSDAVSAAIEAAHNFVDRDAAYVSATILLTFQTHGHAIRELADLRRKLIAARALLVEAGAEGVL